MKKRYNSEDSTLMKTMIQLQSQKMGAYSILDTSAEDEILANIQDVFSSFLEIILLGI